MSRNYYVFSSGRLRRDDNTLYLENEKGRRPVPIEDVDSLFLFGETDLNTKLLVFLAQKRVCLHVFNYYGHYSGSYYPREYLNSGYLLVRQVGHHTDPDKRMAIARELVSGAAHSMMRTLAYYAHRKDPGAPEDAEEPAPPEPDGIHTDDDPLLESMEDEPQVEPAPATSAIAEACDRVGNFASVVPDMPTIPELMGIEGKMREAYFAAWSSILRPGPGIEFEKRVRRPPDNMVNALISFGNGMLYAVCVKEIYRTQLNPTISYLHEPGDRRYSLALDLAEVFKPLIVDRVIFRCLNTRVLRPQHFDLDLNACRLSDEGRKLFVQALEERLQATIRHRRLKRHVSYQHLIRLECYRLIRDLTEVEPYRAFRAWW